MLVASGRHILTDIISANWLIRSNQDQLTNQGFYHQYPPDYFFVSPQRRFSLLATFVSGTYTISRWYPSLWLSTHLLICTITKGLFESKVNPAIERAMSAFVRRWIPSRSPFVARHRPLLAPVSSRPQTTYGQG